MIHNKIDVYAVKYIFRNIQHIGGVHTWQRV